MWGDVVTIRGTDNTRFQKVCIKLYGPELPGEGVLLACPDSTGPKFSGIINYHWYTSSPLPSGYQKTAGTYYLKVYHYDYSDYVNISVFMGGEPSKAVPCGGTFCPEEMACLNGSCTPDYWIGSGPTLPADGSLSCSPPRNSIIFSGNSGRLVPAGTRVLLRLYNMPSGSLQDIPSGGISIGSTATGNYGNSITWKYTWDGTVPSYLLKNNQSYQVKVYLADQDPTKNFLQYRVPYSCP
jgi:hypothetical protein